MDDTADELDDEIRSQLETIVQNHPRADATQCVAIAASGVARDHDLDVIRAAITEIHDDGQTDESDASPDRSATSADGGTDVGGGATAARAPAATEAVDEFDDDETDTPLDNDVAVESGHTFYPELLRGLPWWVNWVRARRNPGEKPTKQPSAPYKNGGSVGTSQWRADLPDWKRPQTDADEVERWEGLHIGRDLPIDDDSGLDVVTDPDDGGRRKLGAGIIIPPSGADREENVVLLDWDDVRDPETGEIHPVCAAALREFDGFAEISQSGEGIHQFAIGEIPGPLNRFLRHIDEEPFVGDDLPMIEMYQTGRFCALTGRHVEGTGSDVDDAQDLIDRLCWTYGAGTNNNEGSVTDPFAQQRREDADVDADAPSNVADSAIPSHDEIDQAMREAAEYDGDDPTAWELPDGESLEYHALLRLRERDGVKTIPNWELIGLIAGAGHDCGLDKAQVLADLKAHPAADKGYRPEKAKPEVSKAWRRAEAGSLGTPSRKRLVRIGALPQKCAVDRSESDEIPTEEQMDKIEGETLVEKREDARERGLTWPSTDEAREDLLNKIRGEIAAANTTVLDAPTSLGKSHTVATEPWLNRADHTDERPVIHLHATREARDQAAAASRESGVATKVIKARHEACCVAAGEYDDTQSGETDGVLEAPNGGRPSEWFARMCEDRGISFSTAHQYFAEHTDVEMPCCAEDGADCPAITQWEDVPTDGDGVCHYDVIHGTHQMAYVPSVRQYTNLIFDEQPSFVDFSVGADDGGTGSGLTQNRVRTSVTELLQAIGAPISTWEQLVTAAKADTSGTDAAREFTATIDRLQNEDNHPSRRWYFEKSGVHTAAPALAQAVAWALTNGADANGRYSAEVTYEPPRLDGDAGNDGWNLQHLRVVIDESLTLRRVRKRPSFSVTRSVVGLDAHPTAELWGLNFDSDGLIDVRDVLTETERRRWRRLERGLDVVQLGEYDRSYSRGWNNDENKGLLTLAETLRNRYGDEFRTLLTAKSVIDDALDVLEEAGVDDPVGIHYGAEKSRNDFKNERVGLVDGCVDPGDDYVHDGLAELGVDATPERWVIDVECPNDDCGAEWEGDDPCGRCECDECTGVGCQKCGNTGFGRAIGRGWKGEGADVAENLLRSVRENHVAQAIGRYAREPQNDENYATVFVRTAAVPEQLRDFSAKGEVNPFTDNQRAVADAIRAADGPISKREITETADVSRDTANREVNRLVEHGFLEKTQEASGPRPAKFCTDGGADLPKYGIADVDPA